VSASLLKVCLARDSIFVSKCDERDVNVDFPKSNADQRGPAKHRMIFAAMFVLKHSARSTERLSMVSFTETSDSSRALFPQFWRNYSYRRDSRRRSACGISYRSVRSGGRPIHSGLNSKYGLTEQKDEDGRWKIFLRMVIVLLDCQLQ